MRGNALFGAGKAQSLLGGRLDRNLLAQAPKLAPHILQMRENLAAAIGCAVEQVSVKATTEEGLGFTGSKQGIAAHCVCLLERI